jgi:hypothetical protein
MPNDWREEAAQHQQEQLLEAAHDISRRGRRGNRLVGIMLFFVSLVLLLLSIFATLDLKILLGLWVGWTALTIAATGLKIYKSGAKPKATEPDCT